MFLPLLQTGVRKIEIDMLRFEFKVLSKTYALLVGVKLNTKVAKGG